MTGEELKLGLIAEIEQATKEERMIELAYLTGTPLDPIFAELAADAKRDYQAARTGRTVGTSAGDGPTATG